MSNVGQMKWQLHKPNFFHSGGLKAMNRPSCLTFEHLKPAKVTPWSITGTALDRISKLLWISSKEMRRTRSSSPNQAACSVAIKWGCSVIHQFCRLWQCSWLGCCICTFSFISLCVWAVIFPCWSTSGTCQVGFHLAQQFEVSLSRCRASHVMEIPWIQMPTVFWMERSLPWIHPHPSTHLMYKSVQEGL